MSQPVRYEVGAEMAARAHIDRAAYQALYRRSIEDPSGFWAEQAQQFVTWSRPWARVLDWDYQIPRIRWFEGAKLNVAYNCLDRHLASRGDRTAILWEADEPGETRAVSYRELFDAVCRFANALKARGVGKGDRVAIYLPMVPEAAVAMLACARIGAVHSVVFGGFSPESLKDRILDSDCRVVVTADEGLRGGRHVPLKANVDAALLACPRVHTVFVVRRTGRSIAWQAGRDLWYHETVASADPECPPVEMDAEDPLFILYTSGSTGKPKGVLHTSGGYLVYAAITHRYVFDYRDGDIYWCTADVGWVTGHTYCVYGPLCNGATTLMFEGIPTHPNPGRFWEVVDRHRVNILYTAPTAIRANMAQGDAWVQKSRRTSLRILGTVGEPINPEAWEWYYRVVGDRRCPIVDTWWQTETGGIMITPLPAVVTTKPGSATIPYPGIVPELVDAKGNKLEVGGGFLTIAQPWPGMLRTIFGDDERYREIYWSRFPDRYFTGDGAKLDEDGYWWILGRVDDVLNVAGHRVGTMEVESALVDHPAVAEAAVVGRAHDLKGQALAAFVTLKDGQNASDGLKDDLKAHVTQKIGAIARPDDIFFSADLPKTRSGKIMRRLLKDIAEGRALGDTTTLADPNVVSRLKEMYEARET
ncbi:MAG: acetate--CoA ligase [Gammaproteobacteria bacterium]|nr:acetate--CoA ligase [Gammaproteobacteria bacterium]